MCPAGVVWKNFPREVPRESLIQSSVQYVQQAAECKQRVYVQKHYVYILQLAVHTV